MFLISGSSQDLYHSIHSIKVICSLFSNTFTSRCPRCQADIDSLMEHIFCRCGHTSLIRSDLYQTILNCFGYCVFRQYLRLDPRLKVIALAAGFQALLRNELQNNYNLLYTVKHLSFIWNMYNV